MNVPAISPALPQALAMALDDEYRARATYQAVIAYHGPVTPFSNIVQAEQRHIDALTPMFDRYGVPMPADRWAGNVVPAPSLQENCEAGVAGEIRNYQMYDQLLTQVYEPDVRAVFSNLRNASAYHHLPAFQACAQRYGATPPPITTETGEATSMMDHVGAAALGMLAGIGVIWAVSRIMNTTQET
jgi:hypothetical protein